MFWELSRKSSSRVNRRKTYIRPEVQQLEDRMMLSGTSLFPDRADAELGSGFYAPGSLPSTTIALSSPGDQSNDQGDSVSLQILGSGSSAILFAATGLPPGLAIDLTSGFISGNVAGNGPYETTVLATDGFSQAELTFFWEVDSPLSVAHPGDQTNSEGDGVSLQIQATGPTGSPLSYFATGLPDGLDIDSDTGLITGTIAAGLAGSDPFATTITVTNGAFTDSQTFSWHVNGELTVLNPGDQANSEGDTVALQIQASDTNSGVLTYSAYGLPDGLDIEPATGLISGTISASAAGDGPFTTTIIVANDTTERRASFTWNVVGPVSVTNPGRQSSPAGTAVALQVQAVNSGSGDLTYSAAGLPRGLHINPDTGLISGILLTEADELFAPTITVRNGTSSARQSFSWYAINPVTLTNPGNQSDYEGDTVAVQMEAVDVRGGSLVYSATGLPEGLSIEEATGAISGTISTDAGLDGLFVATVTVSDGAFLAQQTFLWDVSNPIRLASPGRQEGNTGEVVALQLQANDLRGGSLSYSATGLPDGLALDSATGLVSGTLGTGGKYQTTIIASAGGASSRQSFTWDVGSPVTILTPGDQSSREGATVSLQVQASTTAAASLNYSATGLPDGLAIDPDTGLISGTVVVGASATGRFNVAVIATDGTYVDRETFVWRVTNPIAIVAPGDQTNVEGDSVWVQIQATNAYEGTLTYSATGLPDGLTLDPDTGLISGTVSTDAAIDGLLNTTVVTTDGMYTRQVTFTWDVRSPITITEIIDQRSTEGDVGSLEIEASDAFGSTFTYAAAGLPDGLSIDPVTGVISGTITAGASVNSPFAPVVTATDGTFTGRRSFTWTVRAPIVLQGPADQSSGEGDVVALQVPVPAGEHLSFFALGLPDGLGIDSATGLISGTVRPTAASAGPYSVVVLATDGVTGDEISFTWEISSPVTLTNPEDQSSTEGTAVSLQVQADNATEATLTYSAEGLPDGLSIDPDTGLISGTILDGASRVGPFTTTVTATDGTHGARQTFRWEVSGPPTLREPGDQGSAVGDTVLLPITASATGGALSYTASGLPAGLSIDADTGVISGTLATAGTYQITVIASNGAAATTTTFPWSVSEAPEAGPIAVVNPGTQTSATEASVSLPIQATNTGGGSLTYSATGLPNGLTIDANTGVISGTIDPAASGQGPFGVTVTATNGTDSAEEEFNWIITSPITVTSPGVQTAAEGDVVSLQIEATNTLSTYVMFSATGLPPGLSIDAMTGLITGTVAAGAMADGPFTATVSASDGTYTDRQTFAWLVVGSSAGATPSITVLSPGDQSSGEGQSVTLQILALDPSGGTLNYSATGLPSGLSIDAVTGVISGTISANASGSGPFTTTVTAGNGTTSGEATFLWNVSPAVTPPSGASGESGGSVPSPPTSGGGSQGESTGSGVSESVGPFATTPLDSLEILATAPDGMAAAAQTTRITSGGYNRHYTYTASGDDGSAFLEVTIVSEFSLSGEGEAAFTIETGTLTYVAWAVEDGIQVVNVSDVVPFESPVQGMMGFSYFGIPSLGGPVYAYSGWALGINVDDWTYMDYEDELTFNALGTYRESNGVTYRFHNRYGSNNWWDWSRTWTPGAEAGAGTEVIVTHDGGSYASDITVSNKTENFTSGETQLNGEGRPDAMFAAPAQGTKYLSRSFDTRDFGGNSTITTVLAEGGVGDGITLVQHRDHTGVAAYRYFFSDTRTTGSRGGTDPSEDRETWRINYQWEGDYGGSRDEDRSGPDLMPLSGTVTTKWNNGGTVLVNSYDYTDVYFQQRANGSVEGTYRFTRDDNGSPATYKNEETREQVYCDSNEPASDTLDYRYEHKVDARVSVTDRSTFTLQSKNGEGVRTGEARGSGYASSVTTTHADGISSGLANLLDETATIDDVGNARTDYVTLSYWNVRYTAADGSLKWTLTTSGIGNGSSSVTSKAQGDIDAEGTQVSGTSYDRQTNRSWGLGTSISTQERKDTPRQKANALVISSVSGFTLLQLTHDGNGSVNGSLSGNSDDTVDEDATVTRRGVQKIPDGATRVNERDHRHTRKQSSSKTSLSLATGLPTGHVNGEVKFKFTYDFSLDRKTDLSNDKLHARLGTIGNGYLATGDKVDLSYDAGKSTATRSLDQRVSNHANGGYFARGTLSDAAGYTGTWELQDGTFGVDVVDWLKRTFIRVKSKWEETSRRFGVDHSSRSGFRFDQVDDGLGRPGLEPGEVGTTSHTLTVRSEADNQVILIGSPKSHAFDLASSSGQKREEKITIQRLYTQSGDAHYLEDYTAVDRGGKARHIGTNNDGIINTTKFSVWTHSADYRRTTSVMDTARRWVENNHEHHFIHDETREGPGQPSGTRWISTLRRDWTREIDKTSWWGGMTTSGNPDAEPQVEVTPWPLPDVTLWETLWDDYRRHPDYSWLIQNGGSVLRIAGGIFDVVLGASITLGTAGWGSLFGIGLMALGVDQIVTGWVNSGPGQDGPSVIEFGGYSGARGLGFGEGTSQTIGTFTPVVMSLTLGWLGTGPMAGAAATTETGATLGAPRIYRLGQAAAVTFPGVNAVSWWHQLSLWFTPGPLIARLRLFLGGQFAYGGTVSEARGLLARLTIMTEREVGLLRLADGRQVIRLGRRRSLSATGAVEVLAHTHPSGVLELSMDHLTLRRLGEAYDTLALRNIGQNRTFLFGPNGEGVLWTSPNGTWRLGDLFFEIMR